MLVAPPGGMFWHHFTVDVEEYFQVSAFEGTVPRFKWSTLESRVAASVDRLLDLLARQKARGTFFVVGWVAQRHPDIVRTIVAAGHEIGSHTWDHVRVTHQTPEEFRASVRRSKYVLEELSGAPVLGFRAPSFSIVPGREWALDILLEEGYRYDSSLFPIRRPGYGFPNGKRDPHWLERKSGRLMEVPPATVRWGGTNFPAGGGAYFRFLPYELVRDALRACERRGVPGTFYIHPWEIDPQQPRFPVSWLTRMRHYGGLARTESRLQRLLGDFRFRSIASTVGPLLDVPAPVRVSPEATPRGTEPSRV
jgi:polysaccharide deacetylase family protein (PEP-CTERM system associated)